MKAQSSVDREMNRLRRLCESVDDPLLARIAWEVLHAIRWAREDTTGWPKPTSSAISATNLIREDMRLGKITTALTDGPTKEQGD